MFEHIKYTPYGETWVEKSDDLFDMLPYKFTAKELDEETGLYYYGARYLNPRTSRWISSDPLGFDLINPKRNGFNFIESQNWYSYVNNNPVIFYDPTGMFSAKDFTLGALQVIGGVVELAATYVGVAAAEAVSVGGLTVPATLLAIAGTADGFRNVAEGTGKIAASFDDKVEGISIPQEITGNLSKALGASGEMEQSVRDFTDGLETVGEFFMPGKAAIQGASLLLDKAELMNPVFDTIDEALNDPPTPSDSSSED